MPLLMEGVMSGRGPYVKGDIVYGFEVIASVGSHKPPKYEFLCGYCDASFVALVNNLKRRKSKSCGCLEDSIKNSKVKKCSLEPIKKLDKTTRHGAALWEFQCVCGKIVVKSINHYRMGNVKSCGCISKEIERQSKGLDNRAKTRLYRIYRAMIDRCKPQTTHSKWHGDLGIRVSSDWLESFDNFKRDMVHSYSVELTLDRIDPNKGYSKDNCRWATYVEQSYNQRVSKRSKTGVAGVRPYGKGKWLVTLQKGNNMVYKQIFSDLDEAIKARREQEVIHYGYNK